MKPKSSTNAIADPRFLIVAEMMAVFVQDVKADRVKAFLKFLGDVPTDLLRTAVAGCVESGQQRGCPSVAEIRRRVAQIRARTSRLGEPVDCPKERPENLGLVERLRDWNYCEFEVTEMLDGNRPVATAPKVFSKHAQEVMRQWAKALKQPEPVFDLVDELLEEIPF